MSKLDDPSYKEVCRLAEECGLIVELHVRKSMSKIPVFTIQIKDKEKLVIQKTQFRQESIDSMAAELLKSREKWAIKD